MVTLKKNKITSSAVKISLIYLLLGILWIALSDKILFDLIDDEESAQKLEFYKGWFFVIITALVLYFLIRKSENVREKLEFDLTKSNEHWKNIFESANDPVFILDKNYRIIEANSKAEELYGYTIEEFKNLSIKDIRSPETHHLIKQQLEGALTPSGIKYELSHKKKNGDYFPVEISTKAVVREGKLEYIHIVHDLTERKKIEDELVESEKKYRGLIETTHDLVWSMNNEGSITYINDASKKVFGYSPEEIIGKKTFRDFVTPQDIEERTKVFEESIRSGSGRTQSETRAINREGKIRYLLSNSYVTRDSEGNVTGLSGTSIDITERVEAENRVKYLNRVYALLSNINQLIVRVNDREKVLSEACRIAVEEGKFKLAWIGFLNQSSGKIEVNYHHGSQDGYLESLNISINESEKEMGPIVRAFKEGAYYVCNNIESDRSLEKWKKKSLEQGFRSFATFPIKVKNEVVAVYNVYSENVNIFEKQETELLLELAGDISFALEHFDLEKERKVMEERYRKIVESAPIGILISIEGKLEYANPEFVKIMGAKSAEELYGKEVIKFINPEYHEIVSERRKQILKGLKTPEIEQVWSRVDGSSAYLAVSALPYYFREDIVGVQVLVRDISERRKMTEDIKESQARLKGIVNSAMDAIITIDSSKNIVLFNDSAEKMFGYMSYEVTGKNLNILIPQRFHEVHNEHIKKFGKSGTTSRSMGHLNPLSGLRKDGEEFPIEASISQVEVKGEKYYTAIIRDITERMQNEKAIRESNERLHGLAAHLQTIREDERTSVAREIHDQLGQELTALKMDISFLKKRIETSGDNPEWGGILESLKSMTDVTDQTINSVRKIARELRPDLLDKLGLREAIEWHTEEFEKRTGIKYHLDFPEQELSFDQNLNTTIFRIVQESLTNVARHSKAGEVSIELKTDDRYLYLEIKDNGRGISEDEINNTKSLGLVGIRERAYSAGGEFKIKGIEGKGTELKIIIPLESYVRKYD